MIAALATALAVVCAAAPQAEVLREVEATSPSGRYVARIAKAAGQERVADVLARWRLTVHEIGRDGARTEAWSCVVQHRPGERSYFVSDDGCSAVELTPRYDSKQDLVRVWRGERELAAIDADELGLERSQGSWLSAEGGARVGWIESPRGPLAQLLLVLADGRQRRVDLESGEAFSTHAWVSTFEWAPIVDDELRRHAAAPYVASATAPARVPWGEVIEIAIAGSHPTPNWRFVGIELGFEGDDRTTIVITPLSSPPSGSVQLQVLERFEAVARLSGLMPGSYSIRVQGRGDAQIEPIAIEVAPARALLELAIRGGILGLDDSIRAFASGVVSARSSRGAAEPSYHVLDAVDRRLFEAAFAELPRSPSSSRSSGADMFEYTLRWTQGERQLEWRFDDGSADAVGRELVRVLREAVARK